MITKIHGIVLSVVRHNERNNIVTLYTAERGRMACLSSAAAGKSGRLRNARLQPLALIESNINFRENRDLQFLGAVTAPAPWRDLYFNPAKAPIVIFISEFLRKILQNSEQDRNIWNYILSAIATLDKAAGGIANYHISFLIGLLHFIGIAPDVSDYSEGDLFNMRTSEFTPRHPGHGDVLSPEETALIPLLIKMNFRNMAHFRFNVVQRRRLLRILLNYYAIHLSVSPEMKSLDILSELFGTP
ncbi:MAG: DNA repair protein RecO C-terminal domain-containing protein [Muribaculaceae bacterium]|nr:DNA repair protein RecO C-terminal domain-containing protein [Muribaculaceae bacterium]